MTPANQESGSSQSTILHLLNNNLVLFDGVCNLCNSTVDFLIRNDKRKIFYFSSLQSEAAQKILKKLGYDSPPLSSIIFIENGQAFDQSTAVLKIMKKLGGPWAILYIFIIVPKMLRDLVYKLVAINRYNIFGKRDSCRLPTEEERNRFIF